MEKKLNILLVEDEFLNAMLMEKQLKHIGYTVSNHIATGENAIIKVRQEQPDVILMDIRLAGEIDGIEAASVIKSEFGIPIIFITGYDDQVIRERAEKLKPLGYLIKPLDIDELKAIIDGFISQ